MEGWEVGGAEVGNDWGEESLTPILPVGRTQQTRLLCDKAGMSAV